MGTVLRDYIFKVEMSCDGCAQTVSKVLSKFKDQGIPKFETNLKEKIVIITSALSVEEIIDILQKSGKEVTYLGERS